jgi:hypothetical protein
MFHYSGTVRLVLDRVATPLPAGLLLLLDVTVDAMCSSIACAAIVMLISCLLCRNLVTALHVLQYEKGGVKSSKERIWKIYVLLIYTYSFPYNFFDNSYLSDIDNIFTVP